MVVVVMTRVMLFVLDLGMLKECENDGNSCVGDGGYVCR